MTPNTPLQAQVKAYGQIDAPKGFDIGFDIYAPVDVTLYSRRAIRIDTDLRLEMPSSIGALVTPRSSLNAAGVICMTGLIDPGYIGRIGVVLYNTADRVYEVDAGQRIAQLVFFPVLIPKIVRVSDPDELVSVDHRGEAGFGSTGK